MEISSKENKVFKHLLKLTQKKYRRQAGLCIVEGEKIVREMVGAAEHIFVRKGKSFTSGIATDVRVNTRVSMEGNKATGMCVKGDAMREIILDDKLFDSVSGLENSSGVLAVVKIPNASEITFPYLVLDGIQDAGNVGTIFRTAVAFGFRTIFCVDCADPWSAKVLRASSGVQFGLNIVEVREDEFRVPDCSSLVAADLDGVEAGELGLRKGDKFGLVLGNEGKGIRSEIKRLVNKCVTLPMDRRCESLNVAVAGGILMYELRRLSNVGTQ